MPTTAIIQARMSSTRLPGKVLRPLGGRPVLGWVVRAAQLASTIETVVIATSTDATDDDIVSWCEAEGIRVHRGPLEDVLQRFVGAASHLKDSDTVVRLTADCPLLDPALIDATVSARVHCGVDYLSTVSPRSLPRGLDVEALSVAALHLADQAAEGADRAHVTSWLYSEESRATVGGLHFRPRADDLRVTLDTPEDGQMLDALVAKLGDRAVPYREMISVLRSNPAITAINASVDQKHLEEG